MSELVQEQGGVDRQGPEAQGYAPADAIKLAYKGIAACIAEREMWVADSRTNVFTRFFAWMTRSTEQYEQEVQKFEADQLTLEEAETSVALHEMTAEGLAASTLVQQYASIGQAQPRDA